MKKRMTMVCVGVILYGLLTVQIHAEIFDVKKYGATGDGQTYDTAAINKAIEAAAAAGGGTVHFPAGTYLSFSIRLKSNIASHSRIINGENFTYTNCKSAIKSFIKNIVYSLLNINQIQHLHFPLLYKLQHYSIQMLVCI